MTWIGIAVLKRGSLLAFAVLTGTAAVLATSACGSQVKSLPSSTPPVIEPTPSTAVADSPAPQPNAPLRPSLRTAAADKVLVPPMSGTGSAQTPPFQIKDKLYTVRIACVGSGELQLFPGVEEADVSCDGTTRRIHVSTDAKRERVPIAASATQQWTVSVVVTKDFSVAD